MVRDGGQYIEGLKDDRAVWLDGAQVSVTDQPEFAGSLKGMAGYFDWQNRFAEDCLVDNPDTGDVTNASLLVPRNADDLAKRHRAFDRLARYSYGMLGRTPDYVNTTLSGFTARRDGFDVGGGTRFGDRVVAFHKEVAAGDLSLTHAIVNPVIDKEQNDVSGINAGLATRVVERKSDRIVVRGAKILATLAPFADEMFVYPSGPLPADAPPEYALSFSIPVGAKGVVTLCRDHVGVDAPVADNPFSSRFDEQDAFVIFDDVEVPLERVFIDGSVKAYNDTPKNGWMSNILQQTCIRAAVKLEFAYDLCARMAKICNSRKKPEVLAMLGELRTYANLTRAGIRAGEAGARDHGNGAFFLDQAPVRAVKNMMPAWMIRANEIIIAIGSHNLLCAPPSAAFANPRMAPALQEYLIGANDISAQERAAIFRIAWDFAGSALGARVALYERFYLTSQLSNFKLEGTLARFERREDSVSDLLKELATS
jgi:4-hydroxyphenylacetate 3-monooxygenase/anthranilate 3-monooxygenase (FAD)/4-hydroxyphenylacetate 3-monooxygenase